MLGIVSISLSSKPDSLLEKQAKVSPPVQQNPSASLLANQKDSKPVNQQTSKLEKKFTSKTAKQKASKLAEIQTTKEKKKYGTYLKEASISAIQMLAIQTKRKDHEVLQEIVDTYFLRKN